MLQATGYPAEIADFYSTISAGYWGVFLVAKTVQLVMRRELVSHAGVLFCHVSLLLVAWRDKMAVIKSDWLAIHFVDEMLWTIYHYSFRGTHSFSGYYVYHQVVGRFLSV